MFKNLSKAADRAVTVPPQLATNTYHSLAMLFRTTRGYLGAEPNCSSFPLRMTFHRVRNLSVAALLIRNELK